MRLVDTATEKPPAAKTSGFRAGAELREARERLGWDLGEVAAALRIKLAYLQAIEDGRISALPGNAYALGFLRTYATTLGLDADEVARRFRAEANDVNRRTELSFPAPVPERGVPTGALVLIGLMIALVAYAAWYRLSDREQTPTHTVPPVPESLLPARKPAPVSPQVASVLPPPGSAVPSPSAPVAGAPPGDLPGASAERQAVPQGGIAPAAPPATAPQAAPAPPAALTPQAPAAGTPPASPMPAGVVLHASAATWVQVRVPGGRVIWDHVMQPGDTWSPPPDAPEGLVLTTGNAGGLSLSAAGVTTGPLGRNGAVRRNITLDPATVKEEASAAAGSASAAAGPASATTTPPRRHPAPAAVPESTADQLNAQQLGH